MMAFVTVVTAVTNARIHIENRIIFSWCKESQAFRARDFNGDNGDMVTDNKKHRYYKGFWLVKLSPLRKISW